MIFEALKVLGIPYCVVKYKESLLGEVVRYRYEILIDFDMRMRRHKFIADRSITHKGNCLYMYRRLTEREVRIFHTYNIPPSFSSSDGIVWEIAGSLKRRPQQLRINGRFAKK